MPSSRYEGVLLAIDPGADAGWAVFGEDKKLESCGLNEGAMRTGTSRVVIERPMIYPGGRQKARPADIIKLACRAGEWGGETRAFFGVEPEYVEPATWKGQLSKEICHARIWDRLDANERAIVAKAGESMAPSKRHNMLDAVGIGLYALGRGLR